MTYHYRLISKKVWAIVGSSVAYFIFIAYPLSAQIDLLKEQIAEKESVMMEMTLARNVTPKVTRNAPLLMTIPAILQSNLLRPSVVGIKQEGNQVAVTFDKVHFDDLMNTIDTLWKKNHIEVSKINVRRETSSDFVHATVFFQ